MAVNQPITFRGKRFASRAELARYYSIRPQDLHKRMKRGWTLEQALGLKPHPARKPSRCKSIVFRGMTFESRKKLAEHYGQKQVNFHARLKYGWSLEEALGLRRRKPPVWQPGQRHPLQGNHKPVTVRLKSGVKHYSSFKVACKKHGVDYKVGCARRYGGWTVEQALEVVPLPSHSYVGLGAIYLVTHKNSKKRYVGQTMQRISARWEGHVRGVKEGSQSPLAKAIRRDGPEAFEVKILTTARNRAELNRLERHWIKKLGTSVPNGFNQTKGGSGTSMNSEVVVGGRRYASFTDCAVQHGRDATLVRYRLKRGWTLERAFKTPSGINREKVCVAGRTFPSRAAAARFYGVAPQMLHKRQKIYGWTLEESLGLKKPRTKKK